MMIQVTPSETHHGSNWVHYTPMVTHQNRQAKPNYNTTLLSLPTTMPISHYQWPTFPKGLSLRHPWTDHRPLIPSNNQL